jgi:hypothetical protein
MIGCTDKECKPSVEFLEQKFPVMETVDINSALEIPSYTIAREKINVINDVNVTMSIDTFRKIKDGDDLKVRYLLHRLKVFMFGVEVLNGQAKKYNEKFVKDEDVR